MKLKVAILTLFIAFTSVVKAQVEFTAKASKTTLSANEKLRVDFVMNQSGDNFNPPDFDGFSVRGPSMSVQNIWVNGESSYQKTYSYFLDPTSTGTYTIGSAEVTINGKIYKTDPVDIVVSGAVANPTDGYGKDSEDIASENIHLVAEISNTNPYINEGITVVYKLYVSPKISVSDWQPISNPTFSDFWSQNIDMKRLQVKNGTYKGKPYRYVVLRKTVLYPQKTGKLDLEPFSLWVMVQVPTDRFDFFGNRYYEDVRKKFSAGDRTITVKPLPQSKQPESYTGAVGDFDLEVSVNKKSLKASEAFQVKVKVSGNGNLKLFDLPKIQLSNALEVYSPEHSEKIDTDLSGMHGSIFDAYTVVPKTKGEYTIPSLEFSYFDPGSGSYKTVTSDAITVEVAPNPNASGALTASNKQRVVASGDQFRYIKLDANLKPIGNASFLGSALFWTLFVAPILAIPILLFFGKKRREKANDVRGNKIRKANRLARKYLSEAKKNLGDQKQFYESLERSLHNYLKAKLSLKTSEMSKPNIESVLKERGAETEVANNFTELLKSCEIARYTPTSKVEMKQDYDKAAATISKLDKQLNKS